MYSHSSQVSSRHTFFVEFIGLPETEYAALFFSQPKKKELEVVESDFSKLLAEGKAAEEQAIKIYEEQTTENKIATKTKETEIKYKTKDQKETEALLESLKEDIGGSQKELDAINEYWAMFILTPSQNGSFLTSSFCSNFFLSFENDFLKISKLFVAKSLEL